MEKRGYKKLLVWQKADELAYAIYISTKKFPKEEIYGITSQLRRAALSVPVNIVEGYSRQTKGELKQFINIALGSLAEVEYLLDFSLKLKYFDNEEYTNLYDKRQQTDNLLWKFYKSL
jgi:four helix bundle protein